MEGLRVQRERVSTSVQCIIFIIYVNKTEESSFTAVSPLVGSLKYYWEQPWMLQGISKTPEGTQGLLCSPVMVFLTV